MPTSLQELQFDAHYILTNKYSINQITTQSFPYNNLIKFRKQLRSRISVLFVDQFRSAITNLTGEDLIKLMV
jgi:hypothetical protein